jgi:hypothetical protein
MLAVDQRPCDFIPCFRIGDPCATAQLRFPGKALEVIEYQLDNFISTSPPPRREPLCGKFTNLNQTIFEQEVQKLDEEILPRAFFSTFPRGPDELIDGNPVIHPFDQHLSENTPVDHGK